MDVLLKEAAAIIRAGGVVAIPTETSYGLAVDPANAAAVARLFTLKRRSPEKPILLLVSRQEQLTSLVRSVPPFYRELIDEFWPGPLTLVFEAQTTVLAQLTARTGTIGIRQTPHSTTIRLIDMLGYPITATSANISGAPVARSAAEVRETFPQGVDLILEDDNCHGGGLSTIVRPVADSFCIARHGLVDLRERLPCCPSLLS